MIIFLFIVISISMLLFHLVNMGEVEETGSELVQALQRVEVEPSKPFMGAVLESLRTLGLQFSNDGGCLIDTLRNRLTGFNLRLLAYNYIIQTN